MDERQAQIREGAGLDEARLNVEFIDFLKKWSTPLLVIVAVIALGYFGWQKRREMKAAAVTNAFAQLEAASDAGNPAGLLAVADEHRAHGAVAEIAYLKAADIHLSSYRAGLAPGSRVTGDGTPENVADLLSDADRAKQLDRAGELFQWVLTETTGDMDQALHAIEAMYGLAAVAECRGKFDEARKQYEGIEALARTADMPDHVELAKRRIETLGTLASVPRLYAKSELPMPALPPELSPTLIPVPAEDIPTPLAPAGDLQPAGPPVPEPAPAPTPAPAEQETGKPGTAPPGEQPAEAPKKEEPKKEDPPKKQDP